MKKVKKLSLSRVKVALRRSCPTVLTCIGAVGAVATVVLAVKATPKACTAIMEDSAKNHDGDSNAATKSEMVKSAWKYYVPAAITGVASLTCIFGANVLNRRQQASLASAYALLNHSYADYKRKVKELYGQEAHDKVLESLSVEKVDKNHYIYSTGLYRTSSLDFEGAEEDERLFYDSFSERYFTSTIGKVLQAEYHVNRNFILGAGGVISVNDFYEMLGINKIEGGDSIGWEINDEMYWIDFDHVKTTLDDGMECWIIDMVYTPETFDCHFFT